MTTRGLLFSAALLLGCTQASQRPSPSRLDAAATPADEVVATILGRSIKRRDLESTSLDSLLLGPLFDKYRRERGIAASEAEIAEYIAFTRSVPIPEAMREVMEEAGEDAERDREDANRAFAEAVVIDWKTSRRMYEEYGGTVIFQQANPLEPVGACLKFLQAEEKSGSFQILDAELAESFWAYFKRKHPFVVPPERVDYSAPWWRKKK